MRKKKIVFYQDNAHPRTSVVAIGILNELNYDMFQHLPYSSDFTPSDIHQLPRLKICLREFFFFSTEEEIKGAVDVYFGGFEESLFRDGIIAFKHRWMKCIEYIEDYVEE